MKEITTKELDKNFVLLRQEGHAIYLYELYQDKEHPNEYFTVCKIGDYCSIQPLGQINATIPLKQDFMEYINDHAVIHIDPQNNIPRWRD